MSSHKGEIVSGYDSKIMPQDKITRAETEAMIRRMLKKCALI
ncbi:S-layer homology domain-containing protein [Acetivibrio mesophilus]|uniref:SLH domain-containing protein n=1 Tax=Acetivibrio mesophilus TaxID=2487273 RepID=A0A4Q0I896_9FIRM|nr:hypothetical protein EFD62_01315 [Acetivibrio mesophilus]